MRRSTKKVRLRGPCAQRSSTLSAYHSYCSLSGVANLLLCPAGRALGWARVDKTLAFPWLLLWLSLLRRTWRSLPLPTLFLSFCANAVITSPSWLQASQRTLWAQAAICERGLWGLQRRL